MNVPWGDYADALWEATIHTLQFTVAGVLGSIAVGVIFAMLRESRFWPFKSVSVVYTEIFKNLPLLTTIYIFYFGLATMGLKLSVFVAGSLALIFFYGAYMSEIFRGGLQGVPTGQREAGLALGLGPRTVAMDVVLPQAARLAMPGVGTMTVDLLKGTSLLVTIGGAELMTEGTIIATTTFRPMEVYMVVGLIYFVICFPLSRGFNRLESLLKSGVPITWVRRRYMKRVDVALARREAAAATSSITTSANREGVKS